MFLSHGFHCAQFARCAVTDASSELLALVIAQMERENCDFSTLFTSPEAQPLYEKFLWRTCPIPFWEGRLTGADLPQSKAYATRSADQLEEPHLWQALPAIYEEFNKVRPFAIQRDRSTWNSFTAYKIRDWVQAGALVWLAYPIKSPEEICGYLIAHRGDQGFLIAEIGVKEQHRSAIPNLLYQVVGSFEEGQRVGGRLPEKGLQQFFGPPSQGAGMFWILDQI